MTRPILRSVRESIRDHPFLAEAPRTEELPFTGSAGSRRHRAGRLLGDSRNRQQQSSGNG